MEAVFGQIIFIVFLAISTSSPSSSDLESRNIDVNSTALLSPLSLPDTYLRRGALPPKLDSSGRINQDFRLQDFFWTGSGDSPEPSESEDGGLAWEDGTDGVIRVTQIMTLYTTVLTTIYPVELTPSVVTSSPGILDSSHILESSVSSSFPESSFVHTVSETISASPTLTVSVFPTATVSPDRDPTTSPPPHAQTDQPDLIGSASSNRLYWVNTVIKANGSKVNADLPEFQGPMQKNLARVYASAFKRHLLSSLGVMKKPDESGVTANPTVRRRRRKRRSTNDRHLEREDLDFEWMFLKEQGLTTSQIQSLATTAMNVSVSILNITSDPKEPIVSMNYIVSAEGNPIPGSSAVQDLALVTKYEMEQEIGYEVITKAEALVTLPAHEEMSQTEKAETSPWLIVAIGAICAFVLSSIGLTYFAWKSKRSSISHDSPSPPPTAVLATRHQPGSIEGGVINPAFLGSPVRQSTGRTEQVLSEISQRKKDKRGNGKKSSPDLSGKIPPDSKQKERQKHLASELTTILTKTGKGEHVLPSEVKTEAKSSSGSSPDKSSDSDRAPGPNRRSRKGSDSKHSEDSASRKRRRRKTGIVEADVLETTSRKGDSRPGSKTDEHKQQSQPQRPVSASSREKITFGHLDVCEDSGTIIRAGSGKSKSKKSSSKREDSSKDKRKSQSASSLMLPETIDEVTDLTTTEGAGASQSLEEKDREISESLEDYGSSSRTDSASPVKRDAQVQTPTRSRVKVKTKVKPKPAPRGTRPSKLTKETVYLSETEEIIDMGQFEETSTDSNPLGRMRKRFHQFLDDAFNVMGKRDGEDDEEGESRPKSAKVSISHEVETKDKPERPWTTHVIHEESLKQIRPKSAGAPKKAWADSSERRCHSAKSESSKHSQGPSGRSSSKGDPILEREERPEESDLSSTTVPTITSSDVGRGQAVARSTIIPIFPHYPIYPDIPVLPSAQPGSSHLPSSTDPAVPLIRAIKEEIKRFEKVKVKDEPPNKGSNV